MGWNFTVSLLWVFFSGWTSVFQNPLMTLNNVRSNRSSLSSFRDKISKFKLFEVSQIDKISIMSHWWICISVFLFLLYQWGQQGQIGIWNNLELAFLECSAWAHKAFERSIKLALQSLYYPISIVPYSFKHLEK